MAAADTGNIINRKLQKPKEKLLAALWQGKDNANEVSTVLEQNPELIGVSYNHMKEDGYTPLHLAVLWDRPAIVKILLDKGAEVNRQTARFHYTPLDFTTFQCYVPGRNFSLECRLEMVKGLIEKGALQSYVGDAQSNRAIQLIHSTYDHHYGDYRFDFDFLELVLQDKWMREAIYAPSKCYSDSASFLFKIFEAYIRYFQCKDTESMARVEKILLLAEVNLRQLDQAKAPTNIKAFRNCFEKRDRQRQPEVLWQEWNKCEYLEKDNGINSPQKREREVGYSSFFAWLPRETADAVIELVLPQQKRQEILLSPLSPHFQVIYYDNRGIGDSDTTDEDYTVDLLSRDLLDLVNTTKRYHPHLPTRSTTNPTSALPAIAWGFIKVKRTRSQG